jgi:hypothetical protein
MALRAPEDSSGYDESQERDRANSGREWHAKGKGAHDQCENRRQRLELLEHREKGGLDAAEAYASLPARTWDRTAD